MPYKIKLETRELLAGFDGITCKVNPKMAYDMKSTYLLNYSMLMLNSSDVMTDSYASYSNTPFDHASPKRVFEPFCDGSYRYVYVENAIFYSQYHDRFFGFGNMQRYPVSDLCPKDDLGCIHGIAMRVYADDRGGYEDAYYKIPFPFESSEVQLHAEVTENDRGELLLSFHYYPIGERRFQSVTVLYSWNGCELEIVKAGTPIFLEDEKYDRGIYEPSVIRFGGKYYATLRTDLEAMYAVSDDGFCFSPPKPHIFDDGTLIGSHNTMTRWVVIGEDLYLVYTRRNGKNDHIPRNRAPLYISRFDTARGCLVRDEELIVAPEKGARLGNFSVCNCGDRYIVTVAEWMQTNEPDPFDYTVCQKYGSNNRIWISEISPRED